MVSVVAGVIVFFLQLGAESDVIASIAKGLISIGAPLAYTEDVLRVALVIVAVVVLGFGLNVAESLAETWGLGRYRRLAEDVSVVLLRYTYDRCNDFRAGSREEHFALIKNLLIALCDRLDNSLLRGASFRAAIFCPGKENGKNGRRLYCRISRNAAGAKNPIQERAGFFEPGEGLAGQAFERICPRMGSGQKRLWLLGDRNFKALAYEQPDEDRSVFCVPILHKDDSGKCLGVISIDSTDPSDFRGGRRKMRAIHTSFSPIARILSEHFSELEKTQQIWVDSELI